MRETFDSFNYSLQTLCGVQCTLCTAHPGRSAHGYLDKNNKSYQKTSSISKNKIDFEIFPLSTMECIVICAHSLIKYHKVYKYYTYLFYYCSPTSAKLFLRFVCGPIWKIFPSLFSYCTIISSRWCRLCWGDYVTNRPRTPLPRPHIKKTSNHVYQYSIAKAIIN